MHSPTKINSLINPTVGIYSFHVSHAEHVTYARRVYVLTLHKVMQTASGLPKKSLEERKVSSEGGRSKASGGKKEGLEAAVERLDSERKVARKGVQARFQARFQARTRREIHEDHVF